MQPASHVSRRIVGKFAAALAFAITLSSCAPPSEVAKTAPAGTEADLVARARAIHQSALVLDAHADIVVPSTAANFLSADGLSKVDPTKLKAGGVGAVVMSIAVGPGARKRAADAEARKEADEKLAAVQALAAAHADTVTI